MAVSDTNMFFLPQTDKQYYIRYHPIPTLTFHPPPTDLNWWTKSEAISRCSGAADEARKRGLFEVAELLMPRDAWCPENLGIVEAWVGCRGVGMLQFIGNDEMYETLW